MKIHVREDTNSVEIDGYVTAVERWSKPLSSPLGDFLERVETGAFTRALGRNDDVKVLLNHDPEKELGSQKQGNLTLEEDSIGLKARCTVTDPDVVEKAKDGKLVGWSFGFLDLPGAVTTGTEGEYSTRSLSDMDLIEVSILDDSKVPAYSGTLLEVRDGKLIQYRASEGQIVESTSTKIDLNNATYNVKRQLMDKTVEDVLKDYGVYPWLNDMDDQYVYVEMKGSIYRYEYTVEDNQYHLNLGSKTEVVRTYATRAQDQYEKYERMVEKNERMM